MMVGVDRAPGFTEAHSPLRSLEGRRQGRLGRTIPALGPLPQTPPPVLAASRTPQGSCTFGKQGHPRSGAEWASQLWELLIPHFPLTQGCILLIRGPALATGCPSRFRERGRGCFCQQLPVGWKEQRLPEGTGVSFWEDVQISRSNHTGGVVSELEDVACGQVSHWEPSAPPTQLILVGAAVSSQVEDEKAREFICTQRRKGDEVRTPTFQFKATSPFAQVLALWRMCC